MVPGRTYGTHVPTGRLLRAGWFALNHSQRVLAVVGAGKHFFDLDDFEDALDERCSAELKHDGLVCSPRRLRSAHDRLDNAGVDEGGLAQIQDQVIPTLERTVDRSVERRRVCAVEVSFEADGDDVFRLIYKADGLWRVLGADV